LTDKDLEGMSENLPMWVSVWRVNPTGISVQGYPRFSDLFWRRATVCGKHMVSDISAIRDANSPPGIFGRFQPNTASAVLILSAYL
jgi:hypothetical protein